MDYWENIMDEGWVMYEVAFGCYRAVNQYHGGYN